MVSIPPRFLYYGLKVLGMIGALGTGMYTTFIIMWGDDLQFRTAIVFFYLAIFCVFIISAELGLLNHPHFRKFGRFLTTCVGRAAFYIFIGGLQLDGYGYITGIYMISLGVLNVLLQCFCAEKIEKDLKKAGIRGMMDVGAAAERDYTAAGPEPTPRTD